MIRINLLPAEFRQKRRTPVRFMAGVAASVAINTTLVFWWAWTAFGVAAEVDSELALLRDAESGLNPQVAYHHDLEKESKELSARVETLEQVTGERVSWTANVDRLIDVVNDGGEGDKYLIWFDDLAVDRTENKRRKTFGSLKAQGHSGGADFSNVANFLEDLENSPLTADFLPPAPPQGQQSTVDEELMPAEVWSFPMELDLRDPVERRKP